ncbi:MAG TPA: ABC transporter ATP-binding protein [Egibacteraceae bacterium]|nr:ABC transporter ATP-binding protein [Egibacteraceae bacterium]
MGLAIACHDVWKSYRIYHQRSHTLKEKVLSRRNVFEEFWALRGIDLAVREGASMGIIGANGSGKSTLLKTMARILTPNKGSVMVNGSVSPLLELGTGFHPELTGRENVFMACSVLGQKRRDVEDRYEQISAFAEIESFMDIPVKNYSSGMYARLAFAVAISVEPEILIIDEVLSVGDESFQMRCHQRLDDLRAQGRTIVLVSHSLPTISAMCTDAAWVDHGEIREVGTAEDVVASYMAAVQSEAAEHAEHAEHHPTGKRYGSGQAQITDVSFVDGDGQEVSCFRTGDPFTVRLAYRAHAVDDELVCGIGVLRAENLAYLFGQNTVGAGVPLPRNEGTVEFTLPSLPLLKGEYVVNVALHDGAGRHTYDCHDRQYWFSVVENSTMPIEGGMMHVTAEWSAWTSPVSA